MTFPKPNRMPWIAKAPKQQKPDYNEDQKFYNSRRWRKVRTAYLMKHFECMPCKRMGKVCAAQMLDHIIRIRDGGARWDKRNWEGTCHVQHNFKRGKEAHGYIEPFIETPHGRIPKRNYTKQ